MSSKAADRPTLQGTRIKTRKRDEREKFDPAAFRDTLFFSLDEILNQKQSPSSSDGETPPSPVKSAETPETQAKTGLKNGASASPIDPTTQARLDALSKLLDVQGTNGKLDYRRYGEALFDIIIAGGILAPGGNIIMDPDPLKPSKTELCVFSAPADDLETVRAFAQVIVKLIRRYKYLEKTLEDEFKKIIVFLKGFTPENRVKLAKLTAILISGGQIPPNPLSSALQDHFVKDGIAADFLIVVLQTWFLEKDAITIWTSLKKAGIDEKIMDFFPASKRNPEHLKVTFVNAGLEQLLGYQKAGLGGKVKKELQSQVAGLVKDDASIKEITAHVRDYVGKYGIPENEVPVLLWNTLMSTVEWNKKEELVAEQALKHLKGYTALLAAFTQTAKAELALIVRVQDFCYENMNFLKVFQKIILLFYKADVLSEDAILKWYKDSHSNKGKSVFLEQMKKFVEWLQNAEEESEGED
jgi:hypothetical protein